LSESVNAAMEEKVREQNRAKQTRDEYANDVEAVQTWLQTAELTVQDRSIEPQILKDHIQVS